jgi:DNA primase
VGLTGRAMEGVLEYVPTKRKDGRVRMPPKYDNTPGFKKSSILYNLNNAKNYAKNGIIVVEGQFDAIRMHNYGYPNTVARMGPVLSDRQVALLYRYTTSVILLIEDCNKLDNETGKVLSLENKNKDLEKLNFGMKVSVAYLEKDPDSSTKQEIDLALQNREIVKNI